MKLLVLGILSLAIMSGASAHASLWVVKAVTHESSTSPSGVNEVLNKYKELFSLDRAEATNALLSGNPVNRIFSVEIRAEQLQWAGKTICQVDDSRLVDVRVFAKVTTANGEGVRFREPSEGDPCSL